nr:histidine-rich glycoprotein-like [Equus caballus]
MAPNNGHYNGKPWHHHSRHTDVRSHLLGDHPHQRDHHRAPLAHPGNPLHTHSCDCLNNHHGNAHPDLNHATDHQHLDHQHVHPDPEHHHHLLLDHQFLLPLLFSEWYILRPRRGGVQQHARGHLLLRELLAGLLLAILQLVLPVHPLPNAQHTHANAHAVHNIKHANHHQAPWVP